MKSYLVFQLGFEPMSLSIFCHKNDHCATVPVFVVGKEGVRDPDLLGEVARQGQDLVLLRTEGQPLVLPVLVQVHRYRVVLEITGAHITRCLKA